MTGRLVAMLALFGMVSIPASATPPGPNGKLVFNCPATPDPNGGVTEAICTMNPDGTGYTKIIDGGGINAQAVWSPDGTKIAFSSSRNSTPPVLGSFGGDIWVVNADGSNPIQLTHSSTDGSPAWSADGRLAFTSFRDHIDDHSFTSSIYVMNADGSNQHAVTTVDTVTFDTEPAWSPDGKRIAFIRSDQLQRGAGIDGGFEEIYTVNDDGSNLQQLTVVPDFIATYGVSKDHPTWSPDGTRIAFIESPWLDFDLAGYIVGVVNADGSDEHFLTRNSDSPAGLDILDVVWSPDGTLLAGTCSYTTLPGARMCLIEAATGEITGPIGPAGFAVYPDWGRAPAPTNPAIAGTEKSPSAAGCPKCTMSPISSDSASTRTPTPPMTRNAIVTALMRPPLVGLRG